MLNQINLTDIMSAVKIRVETGTEDCGTKLCCYDEIPLNAPSPCVYMQLVGVAPANTKTMYVNDYTVWLHVISEDVRTSKPLFEYIDEVQSAMSQNIVIPADYVLISQMCNGIQNIQTDETGERHAVISYTLKIGYGYICKQIGE